MRNQVVQNNDGYTILMVAVFINNKDIIELLLEHNAKINVKNNNGETVLNLAKNNKNNKDITTLLLNHLYKSVHIINIYTLKYYYYDINISEIIYNYIKK